MNPPKTYAEELTVVCAEHQELLHKIHFNEERKKLFIEKLSVLGRYKEAAERIDTLVREERVKFSQDDMYILEGLSWLFGLNHDRVDTASNYEIDYNAKLSTTNKLLANLKERLSELKGAEIVVVKLKELQAELKRVSYLKANTVRLYTQLRDPYGSIVDPFMSFVTAPVLCTIDSDIQHVYEWLATPHKYPSIMLGCARVSINLATGKLNVAPNPTRNLIERQRFSTSYNASAIHPHSLDNHEPCLGDFSGPFREAVSDRDWVYVATIIGLFLSKAAWEDSAGRDFKAAYGNILARIEGTKFKHLAIDAHGMYSPSNYNDSSNTKKVCFEELSTPGDYNVTINSKTYEYKPSIGHMQKVEAT